MKLKSLSLAFVVFASAALVFSKPPEHNVSVDLQLKEVASLKTVAAAEAFALKHRFPTSKQSTDTMRAQHEQIPSSALGTVGRLWITVPLEEAEAIAYVCHASCRATSRASRTHGSPETFGKSCMLSQHKSLRLLVQGAIYAALLGGVLRAGVYLLRGEGGDGSYAMLLAPLLGLWALPVIVLDALFAFVVDHSLSRGMDSPLVFVINIILWGIVVVSAGAIVEVVRRSFSRK